MAEQITPEDYANLVEIVSWANQVALRHYPNITSLEMDQLKFVPNIAVLEQSKAQASLHPFFLRKFSHHFEFSGPSPDGSWVSPNDKAIFFGWKNIEGMRRDKKVGYLGIGVDSAGGIIPLGTQPIVVQSEKAQELAVDMLTANFRNSFAGVATEQDLEEALLLLHEHGSAIEVRGMSLAIICQDKLFLPHTGVTSDALINTFLSRPIKVDFARLICHQFNIPSVQRTNVLSYVQNSVPIEASMVGNPRQAEMDLLTRLDRMGFKGKARLMEAYQSGDIGKQLVENHRINT